jgi:hypothetical protein
MQNRVDPLQFFGYRDNSSDFTPSERFQVLWKCGVVSNFGYEIAIEAEAIPFIPGSP